MTSTTFTILPPIPTKKDIIQRLFEAGHIDFNEMWILLQDEPEVRYIPMTSDPMTPPYPEVWYTTGRVTEMEEDLRGLKPRD